MPRVPMRILGASLLALLCQLVVEVASIKEKAEAQVQGVIGEQVRIPCDIDLTDKLMIVIWSKGSDRVYSFDTRGVQLYKAKHHTKDNRFSYLPFEKPSKLLLRNLTLEDEGIYKCTADFKRSKSLHYVTYLQVIVPPRTIKIFDSSGNEVDGTLKALKENQTEEITCHVTGGRPSPNITWFKENTLLDSHIDLTERKVLRNTLWIGPFQREDQGKSLVCQASNSNLTAPLSVKVALNISYSPLSVEITTKESPLVADEEYHITCRSDGAYPAAIVTWWLDEEQLTDTKVIIANAENTTLSTVTFTPRDDHGGKTLECRAESDVVEHEPLKAHWVLDIHYSPKAHLTMEPEGSINEGTDVILTCNVTANPPPTNITWFHEGRKIVAESKKDIQIEANSLSLTSVTRKTGGLYSCVATNQHGYGDSNGLVVHVHYVPVCSVEEPQIIGASLHEEISVQCSLKASPKITNFRWQFNNSMEIDIPEQQFTMEEKHSLLTYRPRSLKDFGNLMCWGENDLGKQVEPCIFQLVEAGSPDKPENCTFVGNYTSSSVYVGCVEGHDGGLPQIFIAEVIDLSTKTLTKNVSVQEPFFAIDNLPAGTDFLLTIYSANAKGSSEKQLLQVYTAVPTDKGFTINQTHIFPITPILGVLIGVVGALVIVALIIGVVMRLRSDPATKKSGKADPRRGRSPPRPRDGGEAGGDLASSRAETEFDGDGIPPKLKHANIYETVAYETSETGRQTEILPEKSGEKEADNVEYAELNFSNCKKKSKSKKSKGEKKAGKSNGKIHSSADPTLYASIDHVRTEKQKLVAEEKEKAGPKSQPSLSPPPPQNGMVASALDSSQHLDASKAPPTPPPPFSGPDASSESRDEWQMQQETPKDPLMPQNPTSPSVQPSSQPQGKVPSGGAKGGSNKEPETGLKKATGKPTNLDKPVIPKKPSLPPDIVQKKKKRTAETQTLDVDLVPEDSPRGTFSADDSKEDIPLMDATIESNL